MNNVTISKKNEINLFFHKSYVYNKVNNLDQTYVVRHFILNHSGNKNNIMHAREHFIVNAKKYCTFQLSFRLGETSCRVQPFTDSYTYTFAYLLLWDILLTMCEKSSTELRYQYADWLK